MSIKEYRKKFYKAEEDKEKNKKLEFQVSLFNKLDTKAKASKIADLYSLANPDKDLWFKIFFNLYDTRPDSEKYYDYDNSPRRKITKDIESNNPCERLAKNEFTNKQKEWFEFLFKMYYE